MIIYGAGLAGLLAGALNQTAEIIEAGPADQVNHRAVLRFRSPAVGDAVGIPFRKVTVHKQIWYDGKAIQECPIHLANMYAKKVIGNVVDRSIWHLGSSERFIAPEDFHAQLAARCHGRVRWNTRVNDMQLSADMEPILSTLPMAVMARMAGIEDQPPFVSSPITVKRWRIPGANVYQTTYFPGQKTDWYRASITGDLLIAERGGTCPYSTSSSDMFDAFGLETIDVVPLDETQQKYGKILPIDEAWRKAFMFKLTQEYNIFSLGRFATWRNILLDDVLKDIQVINRLMYASSYDRLHATQT